MSLYYEAEAILTNSEGSGGSLKSRIYRRKDAKSTPAQIFALISESSKWSLILKQVIEACGLLAEEKKLTPTLALLLTHDLLLTKRGIAAPTNHPLKLAVHRHKARLGAELTKSRIRRGFATLESLREAVDNGELEEQHAVERLHRHPRWVRLNAITTSLDEQIRTTLAGFGRASKLSDVQKAKPKAKIYFVDPNIPNLLALPPRIDLSKSAAYTSGAIIFQDKASCFPAHLLDLKPEDGDTIDGCAAPGNKTTHLAAIVSKGKFSDAQRVIAFERDKARAITLQKMVKLASADDIVTVKAGADFLAADPGKREFANVGAILLDPSCSGTGIVGRDDALKMHLPVQSAGSNVTSKAAQNKKRKRDNDHDVQDATTLDLNLDDAVPEETPMEGQLAQRLTALSTFQLHILTHAMRFPEVRKITYSTCSIHFEENEGVVFQALATPVAQQRGWRILPREQQVEGLRSWQKRGVYEDGKLGGEVDVDHEKKAEVCDSCIRCEKGTEEGTMGFFVAAFVRDDHSAKAGIASDGDVGDGVDEWNGFSDEDVGTTASLAQTVAPSSGTSKRPRKKKKRQGRG